MIKLINILLEMEQSNFEFAYHSGPRKITVKDIIFDRASLGFHVGTLNQAQWVAAGKTGKGNTPNLPISKFKVFKNIGNLIMTTINSDMAWEHADILLLELIHEGEMNASDAHEIIERWSDLDSDRQLELHKLIDIAERNYGNLNFYPVDSFENGVNLDSSVYKNSNKLSQIRNFLVDVYNIGAIKYINDVEGTKKEYSICVLDKSMIQDV